MQTSRQDFCGRGGADIDPSALLLALEACHLCKKSISLTHELFMSQCIPAPLRSREAPSKLEHSPKTPTSHRVQFPFAELPRVWRENAGSVKNVTKLNLILHYLMPLSTIYNGGSMHYMITNNNSPVLREELVPREKFSKKKTKSSLL